MSFGICLQNYSPLRAEPSEKSEMLSQILYGELIKIIESNKSTGFSKVILLYDDYEGWVDTKTIVSIDEDTYNRMSQLEEYVLPDINNRITLNNNSHLNIGAGSSLRLKKNIIIYPENVLSLENGINKNKGNNRDQVVQSALKWINIPYLWGGRSSCGADSPGFVQNIFKQVGIKLPRDSTQQAITGKSIDFHASLRPGDLAFFDNSDGIIVHVGIMLDPFRIIHSSGIIKVDRMDHQGIFSEAKVKYTHNLRLLKDVIGD
ncbi:MAG: C40 family peptidase [Bacteroidales bacterium]|nr:C40 family peptidase [Bacteroidales bacterium]MCF8392019.1 C40 family peptidase [Bacteroidales bacterium]